jgi:hypothetical protein
MALPDRILLLVLVIAAVGVYTVRKLERLINSASSRALADLLQVVNRLNKAVFRPTTGKSENSPAEDVSDALEMIDNIGRRVSKQTPALRRVLKARIGIELSYFREKTGITDEELRTLEQRCSTAAFFPVAEGVIEEWTTHTIIREPSFGSYKAVYPDERPWYDPMIVWEYRLQRREEDEGHWDDPTIEVVIHERCIKCWAVGGRFRQSIPPERTARDENVFLEIPLNEKDLSPYRSEIDKPSENPELRLYQQPWIRNYHHGDLDTTRTFWSLTVIDIVDYVGDW